MDPPSPDREKTRKGKRQVTAVRMTQGQVSLTARIRVSRGRLTALARSALLGAALMLAAPVPAIAQDGGSPFSPVLKINDGVITRYELDQRTRFLTLLRIPGDPVENARSALISDRLAAQQARLVGLRLTADQIAAGMSEFAARANLSTEQFTEALAQGGVDAQTFRDFVTNGLLWRELVRARFGPLVSVSEAEVDRVIANGTVRSAMQLLVSEIVIPVEGDPEDELALAARLRSEITTEAEFAAAARRYSASPSADRGGRLDWTPASNLPPALVQLVLPLGPGQVSQPVQLPNAVAVFALRDVAEDLTAEAPKLNVEYAQFLLPNTPDVQAEAAALANRVDTCKDLWAEARSLPEDRLTVERKSLAEVPQDIALELARLDTGEHSTALTRGGWRVFLMLCAREPAGEEGATIDRASLRQQLQSQELQLMADAWMEELRSEAIIVAP